MTKEEYIKYYEGKIESLQEQILALSDQFRKRTRSGRIRSSELLAYAQSLNSLEIEERVAIETRIALLSLA